MDESFRLLKPYIRGIPIIILFMLAGVLVAKKYLSYAVEKYESTTKIKLADMKVGVLNSNLFKDFDVFANNNKIAAEIELIKSDILLGKAVEKLDFGVEIYRKGKLRTKELYHQAPFSIDACIKDPVLLDTRWQIVVTSKDTFSIKHPDQKSWIQAGFGETLKIGGGSLTILLNDSLMAQKANYDLLDQYEFILLSKDGLLEKIRSNLDVKAVGKEIQVIRITMQSAVPEKAAALVNRLAEAYIADYIETRFQAAQATVNFLDQQIFQVNDKLSSIERSIEKYRNDQEIINIRQETETDLRKISQLKIQQTNVKMNLEAMEDLFDYIQSGQDNFLELAPNFEAFTDLLSTEMVKKIKQLQAEKRDLLITYTAEEERVQVIDRKIDDLTAYLIESIGNTRRNLRLKLAQLEKDIKLAMQVFENVPEKERKLAMMDRDFQIYQQTFNFLNEKKIEAEIAQAARLAFHRILSKPEPPRIPIAPNKTIIVIVSAILGMIMAIVLIFCVHMAKAKVNDAVTIERNSSLPIATQAPRLSSAASIDAHFIKETIQLELKGLLNENSILCISSFKEREGRSFHAYHIAQTLADQGRKVCLLDVAGTLKTGIGKRYRGHHTTPKFEYLNMEGEDAPKSLAALEELLRDIRQNFELIIVNNEPLKEEGQALLYMCAATNNLMVVDSRRTSAKQIDAAQLLTEDYALPSTWFLLNRAGFNPNLLFSTKEAFNSLSRRISGLRRLKRK